MKLGGVWCWLQEGLCLGDGVVKQRGEGVAIVLSGSAVGVWKDAGKSWKAWSSRLVSVKLKVERGCRDKCFMYVFSVYAPTYAASRGDKNALIHPMCC